MNSNTVKLQHQIRQNAAEMQSYFTELSDWEKSIKKKDISLSKNSLKRKETPPIRQSAGTIGFKCSDTVSSTHPMEKQDSRDPSSHVYDKGYKKWDSFDVVSFQYPPIKSPTHRFRTRH